MRVVIEPSTIKGSIRAPRSKSHAIRLIMSSLIAPTEIYDLPLSDDVQAALRAAKALGTVVEIAGDRVRLIPRERRPERTSLNAGGSATVLRFAIALAATLGIEFELDGDETLRRRPLNAIYEALKVRGVQMTSSRLPLKISGKLPDAYIEIRGSESSQYVSGFMLAFCLQGEGKISIVPPLVSKSYIYMTAEVLKLYGCSTSINETEIRVVRESAPKTVVERVWGDHALASFYAASALATGGSLTISDLPQPRDYPGDHSIVEIYRRIGAVSEYIDGVWRVEAREPYSPIEVDFEDFPDLPLAVAPLTALAEGCSKLSGVSRLRIKESDRIEAIVDTLGSFGIDVVYSNNSLTICGSKNRLRSQVSVNSLGDHRVAMMATVLALKVGGVIEEAECVNKSNPAFWEDLTKVGGRIRIE
ncbi:MAG: 3-phosphoshikimate 1-carboxyvinyltransferase [Acidilobaceae archaeon]